MGDLVSVAPYVMWSLLAATTILARPAAPARQPRLAAAIFFWCYFVPIGDIAWNLYGGRGDLAIGGHRRLAAASDRDRLCSSRAFIGGHCVQRRLFADRAVDVRGYLACALALARRPRLARGSGCVAFQ